MRVLAVAVAAFAFAPAAAAALPPPGYHPTVSFERTSAKSSSLKTCTSNAKTRRARSQKRIVTTACEQPPKANVKDLGGFFWYSP